MIDVTVDLLEVAGQLDAEEASIARRAVDGDRERGAGPAGASQAAERVRAGDLVAADEQSHRPRVPTGWTPPHELVRLTLCPTCGADPRDPCQGRRGDRVSHHRARVHRAAELLRRGLPLGESSASAASIDAA